MVANRYFMFIAGHENDADPCVALGADSCGARGQMTGTWEAVVNSCDIPTNRGASATDRSTWAAAKDTQTNCDTARDATTEETLHLITEAALR
eukprot:5095092-Prymnesium_polylepis.1